MIVMLDVVFSPFQPLSNLRDVVFCYVRRVSVLEPSLSNDPASDHMSNFPAEYCEFWAPETCKCGGLSIELIFTELM